MRKVKPFSESRKVVIVAFIVPLLGACVPQAQESLTESDPLTQPVTGGEPECGELAACEAPRKKRYDGPKDQCFLEKDRYGDTGTLYCDDADFYMKNVREESYCDMTNRIDYRIVTCNDMFAFIPKGKRFATLEVNSEQYLINESFNNNNIVINSNNSSSSPYPTQERNDCITQVHNDHLYELCPKRNESYYDGPVRNVQNPYDIEEVIDPCGTETNHDEVLLKLKNGSILGHYGDGEKQHFSFLSPGRYVTTDGTRCFFSVTNDNNVIW